ncbi:hypothetical protein NEIELOOT_02448, partial [Neisseria elongata subsp. glycolytica ATCC 29315]
IWQIHHCGMHAIIPFGKDLLALCFNHLYALQTAGSNLFGRAQQWLDSHHINVKIEYVFLNSCLVF